MQMDPHESRWLQYKMKLVKSTLESFKLVRNTPTHLYHIDHKVTA